jgi:hypothetical protein
MPRIGQVGAQGIHYIGGDAPMSNSATFSTSTAAGWTMIWWALSIGVILFMLFSL